ncbi:DNA-binding transcriptional regulator FabR [Hahella sp. CCB-MM4]|uniref:HTH-type transcriptional repressor FabR n=1 Tax=Hahella sp. (strain CCB-MM4) TaxID=1926491 RepID=UPI000B9B66A5|nr:HTH-type transcriptional repressor FabR [Hahella sp. CCB-MM4]OZG72102.1 DNA-binding transcriptional regulator FabR [Hahella sp. CCB-MM4]
MTSRAEQKRRTRQALMDAALNQLGQDKHFTSLSLREVTREAGIAPTSFYRHFHDLEELGLALVDEAGVALRQLMRQARQRIAKNGGVIDTSLNTFFEFLNENPNLFRLLLRERTGVSARFRNAIQAEIEHFIAELTADLSGFGEGTNRALRQPRLAAEAIVIIVFHGGNEALDNPEENIPLLKQRLAGQLRIILSGARADQAR